MKQFSYTFKVNTDFTPDVPANSYKKHKILRRTLALNITRELKT